MIKFEQLHRYVQVFVQVWLAQTNCSNEHATAFFVLRPNPCIAEACIFVQICRQTIIVHGCDKRTNTMPRVYMVKRNHNVGTRRSSHVLQDRKCPPWKEFVTKQVGNCIKCAVLILKTSPELGNTLLQAILDDSSQVSCFNSFWCDLACACLTNLPIRQNRACCFVLIRQHPWK